MTCDIIARFYPFLPPDIEGFYSISVAISNSSQAISCIYRCRAPLTTHFYSISNVSSINIFHISMSCMICDADIGYDVVLTCWTCQPSSRTWKWSWWAACGVVWTDHRVTWSKQDKSTWETIKNWYVSWLDTIAKNMQFKLIVTGPSVGQADLNLFLKLETLRSPSRCV